ncbi:MAG TPA: hypothetical protein VMW89_13105 [Desulfatiglandales bacterium]|nr:hypothetical protein [Desulfatiglandales bacterium]
MKPMPAEIKSRYDAALVREAVPLSAHFQHRKWLRYYLDFCLKYRYEILKEENLLYFLEKLEDKNQTEQQQKQASHAVSIFYEIENIDQDRIGALKNKKENISTKKTALDATHVDWSRVYRDLDSEIKLRHYSPKTLEAYKGWVRQLQQYRESRLES